MKTSSIVHTLDLSRRRVLHGAALAAGGGALLAGGLTGLSAVAAANKMSQKASGYQGKPKGKQRCDNCVQWAPPASCNIVASPISPAGWCNLYVAKP
jgi:hypothetical protein